MSANRRILVYVRQSSLGDMRSCERPDADGLCEAEIARAFGRSESLLKVTRDVARGAARSAHRPHQYLRSEIAAGRAACVVMLLHASRISRIAADWQSFVDLLVAHPVTLVVAGEQYGARGRPPRAN